MRDHRVERVVRQRIYEGGGSPRRTVSQILVRRWSTAAAATHALDAARAGRESSCVHIGSRSARPRRRAGRARITARFRPTSSRTFVSDPVSEERTAVVRGRRSRGPPSRSCQIARVGAPPWMAPLNVERHGLLFSSNITTAGLHAPFGRCGRGDGHASSLETISSMRMSVIFYLRCGGRGRSRTLEGTPRRRSPRGSGTPRFCLRAEFVRDDRYGFRLPGSPSTLPPRSPAARDLCRASPARGSPCLSEPPDHPAIDLFTRVARRSCGPVPTKKQCGPRR